MMFATLDDLDGSVELLVFGKALAEHEAALAVDQVVLVRGRVDHKEAGKTCLVVQSAEAFQPTAQEIEQAGAASGSSAAPLNGGVSPSRAAPRPLPHGGTEPIHLRVDATRLPASFIEDLKHLIESHPGPVELVLEMATRTGARRLRLGEAYRVAPTPMLHSELEQLVAPALAAA